MWPSHKGPDVAGFRDYSDYFRKSCHKVYVRKQKIEDKKGNTLDKGGARLCVKLSRVLDIFLNARPEANDAFYGVTARATAAVCTSAYVTRPAHPPRDLCVGLLALPLLLTALAMRSREPSLFPSPRHHRDSLSCPLEFVASFSLTRARSLSVFVSFDTPFVFSFSFHEYIHRHFLISAAISRIRYAGS